MKNAGIVESVATLTPDINETEVERKVNFELRNFQQKVVYIGGILNPIAGLLIILTLWGKASVSFLAVWYAALLTVNAVNVYVAYRGRHITPDQTQARRKFNRAYQCLLGLLCLTWGSIVFLYITNDVHYQLFFITFLELCIVGFSIGNMGDFVAAIVSNIGLLIPYMVLSIYSRIYFLSIDSLNYNFNVSYLITLMILSAFSLMVTFVSNNLLKKFFKLSFENVALSNKLESINAFLEERVKERTLELEDSLKVMSYQSTHDLLTDLPNQRLLLKQIGTAIAGVIGTGRMFAVCFLFLNEMDIIDEGLGHQAGEHVIKTVSQRLKNMFKNTILMDLKLINYTVTLSRKDIFIILIEPFFEDIGIDAHVQPILSILDTPISYEKHPIKITGSVGISIYPKDGRDIKVLLMNANAAMLHARKQGGNAFITYTSEDNAHKSRQLAMETSLHSAVIHNEMRIQYQPIINLKTDKYCSMEALIRWQHPTLGLIPPDDFIHLAEANGMIIPLGEWVFRKACTFTKQLHDKGFSNLIVAVNLSSKQLQNKALVETFVNILNEIDLSPEFVELELTESEAYQNDVIPLLKQLKGVGFRLVIDDFGTGYSGLSNLTLFNIDKLKIDKLFIHDIDVNDDNKAIVSNTIALAKKIKVEVLAEGVETEEQLNFLRANGCDLIQGYLFSSPVDEGMLLKLLEKKNLT